MKYLLLLAVLLAMPLLACGPVSAQDIPNIGGLHENVDVTAEPAPAQTSGSLSAGAQAIIEDYATEGLSGAFLLAENGEITLSQGYGIANRDTDAPNSADTVFIVGSIAKDFTYLSIILLVEDGLLDYADTLDTYLPDVPADKAKITIQQLVDHRAGFDGYHDTQGDFEQMSRSEAFTAIMATPLLFEPGTDEEYSNSGYTVLAMIIEEVSGQTYMDFVRSQILEPLGLDHTGYWGDSFADMAYTNNDFNGYGVSSEWTMSWTLIGNGGMVSTVNDLYRFLNALINNELATTRVLFHLDQPAGFYRAYQYARTH